MQSFRYTRWDGSQRLVDLKDDELMEELSDYLLAQGDLSSALRMMMQRGMANKPLLGLHDLLQRLRAKRQQRLDQYNLNSVMDDLKKKLADVLETEEQGIERRLDETRRRTEEAHARQDDRGEGEPPALGEDSGAPDVPPEVADQLLKMLERQAQDRSSFLNALPKDLPGALKELQQYEFMDPEAKDKYDELLEQLKRQVMDSFFDQMQQQMSQMSPEQMEQMRQMVQDLNQMLKDKLSGRQPDFDAFMEQHGDMFGPDKPENLDELLNQVQQRMAQMQSLLDSMSQQQRRQLSDLVQDMLGDMALREELSELNQMLDYLMPRDRPQRYPFRGDESLSLHEAMGLMDELSKLDALEKELRAAQHGDGVDHLDPEKVRQLLGEEEAQSLEALKDLTRTLEDAGYIKKVGERFELTARGMRKIGQKALRDIFDRMKKDRFGQHESNERGVGLERVEDVKPYEYGDPFFLNLEKTVMNALRREGHGLPVKLTARDFEVYTTEFFTESSTVIMLDLSLSMARRGSFFAAKKVALALNSLIKTQFPRDHLYIVGFSRYAREVKSEALPYVSVNEFGYGTNMQQAFQIAQRLLGKHKSGSKQIIMISDGEPTAHIEHGQVYFGYPPSPRTIQETLRAVRSCTRDSIVINTFMLDRSYYLKEFVDQITKINRGRAFYTSPDKLGQYILVDYLSGKRRRIA
ncbi:MAG: VWA domain-containing protein [Chloroflexi bacterium]|nr:VWA domain-containing protein [Chloroflexota bacterium]